MRSRRRMLILGASTVYLYASQSIRGIGQVVAESESKQEIPGPNKSNGKGKSKKDWNK